MPARILSGKEVARELIAKLARQVQELPYRPKLVFIRAGDDPASASYVRSKERTARRAGVESTTLVLEPSTAQENLLEVIAGLNKDEEVDGILLQLPLYP